MWFWPDFHFSRKRVDQELVYLAVVLPSARNQCRDGALLKVGNPRPALQTMNESGVAENAESFLQHGFPAEESRHGSKACSGR
jgi:hypothetical protein